ncbi:nucleotidyltransferase [Ornithinibacillus halotolerans]|uniref:tRNA(Met) cytidine acetate ligase n=1 Tax=Ornithinibacillus halotolerans TaxID=1274357 RepID=A0A916WBP0_9BACI|nr:nucleotidyltransferase [Ornithinibacillus halotolerans]GGA83798.1 UPF0348 protein YlbM [Ornithinibacillus halotolerans]
MNVCGLIVEYNPFHNGHVYHVNQAKEQTNADIIIAVMSGSFLQRGEPAIIDKYHRAKAAITSGVDIVVELPYVFAVQSSNLFAKGSILTLNELGVNSICFGSESGNIHYFTEGYRKLSTHEHAYKKELKQQLNKGISFPTASKIAYETIGLDTSNFNLSQPNNILGFSYVKAILDNNLSITPHTITRINSGYHETEITSSIASATSIRKQLFEHHANIQQLEHTMPQITLNQLRTYQENATLLHNWEKYFTLLHYRVMTMSIQELSLIHDIEEGLEYRIKKTAQEATSFSDWVKRIKTKRYTWTRIQRIFVHILTNTNKTEISQHTSNSSVPYVRLLGMNNNGRAYLNQQKKQMEVPLLTKLSHNQHPMLTIEERATHAYYSILPIDNRYSLLNQEMKGPVIVNK